MTDPEIRLECLRRALESRSLLENMSPWLPLLKADDTLAKAKALYEWVTATAKT